MSAAIRPILRFLRMQTGTRLRPTNNAPPADSPGPHGASLRTVVPNGSQVFFAVRRDPNELWGGGGPDPLSGD